MLQVTTQKPEEGTPEDPELIWALVKQKKKATNLWDTEALSGTMNTVLHEKNRAQNTYKA